MMESLRQHDLSPLYSSFANYIFTCVALVVVTLIRTRYYHGLNKIPGPFLASITSLWKWNVVLKEKMNVVNTELHEKYGSLVRIGPNHVSASSVQSIQVIHRSRGNGFTKSAMYSILQPKFEGSDLHNIFSTQDADYHLALKRTLGTLYSTTAVSGLEYHIDECTDMFMAKMNEIIGPKGSGPVDLASWFQWYAFDALVAVNFSRKFGFMESGTDVDGICNLYHQHMMYFALWGQMMPVERLWSKAKAFVTGSRSDNPVFNFALKLVQERQANPTANTDMLNLFLQLHAASPERLTIRDVIAAAYINTVTAHDVLAITLRAVVYYLAKDPLIQKKMQDEIDAAGLSKPSQYNQITPLKYVFAVINEALRIHPSTGLILERKCPKNGVVIEGKYIPEGTIIGVNSWVINRDKAIFGDDADQFRPERWLEGSPTGIARMRANMFTFGAGARNCIGKNLAMMQLSKVIVELYRYFNITLESLDKEWTVSGSWLTRQSNMGMVLSKREYTHLSI